MSQSVLEDILENSLASSAKRSKRTDGTLLNIELTKILNSSGDKCPPCGTPEETLNLLDEILNNLTYCHLSTRYERIHDKRGKPIPSLSKV